MKRHLIVILLLLFLVGLPSCNEDGVLDLVVITGLDIRLCPCCGGYMINFSNDPEPYSGDFKLAYDLPEDSGINSESNFPIYAWINWEPIEGPCDFIEVKWLKEF